MKLVFFSNFLNHHQTPICEEFYNILGENFTFVSTIDTPVSFLENGYPDCRNVLYNLKSYENDSNLQKAIKLAQQADVVIIGGGPELNYFDNICLKQDNLMFRYFERIFKRGYSSLLSPRALYLNFMFHTRYRNKNVYMLCASAFASIDFKILLSYPKKMFRWGYFTSVEEQNIDSIIKRRTKSKVFKILWVARFIDWKHPEIPVRLAFTLKKMNIDFELNMIGTGELFPSTSRLISSLGLVNDVNLLGSIPNKEVKKMMLDSDIFTFTSDRNEGWGAVLNEAMSCGCAVVASNKIGAAPFLIKNKVNGMLFKSRNQIDFQNKVISLIKDKEMRIKISKKAYETMSKVWSPKKAANNFIQLVNSINNNTSPPSQGPCSLIK